MSKNNRHFSSAMVDMLEARSTTEAPSQQRDVLARPLVRILAEGRNLVLTHTQTESTTGRELLRHCSNKSVDLNRELVLGGEAIDEGGGQASDACVGA